MKRAAVLAERVLCAETVASRFGGARVTVVDGPRRLDPITGAVVVGGAFAAAFDVVRLLSRPLIAGQARRASALVRRLADKPATSMLPTTETLPLSALLTSWCAALHDRGCTQLSFVPRLLESPHMLQLREAADFAGIGVDALIVGTASRPLLLLDDSELIEGATGRVAADAGQAALLATGLASDVVAALIEMAGIEGADVWDKGFDDVGRAVFVQRIERAIRAGAGAGVVRIEVAQLLPPLSSSTSKLAALEALPDPPARAVELARALRVRQWNQWQAVAKLVVELRVPASRPGWWAQKLSDLVLPEGAVVDVVAAPGAVFAELQAALLERGHVVDEPAPSWLFAVDDVDDSAAGLVIASLPPPPPPPRAVGGVRAGDDFALDAVGDGGVPDPVIFAAVPAPVVTGSTPVVDGEPGIVVPAGARAVRVTIDGVALPSSLVVLRPLREGGAALELPDNTRAGSVVVIAWDADAVDDLADAIAPEPT